MLLGEVVGRTNLVAMYWTPAQMIAHHTANGCSLRAGRSPRQRHRVGPGGGIRRMPARTHAQRPRATRALPAADATFLEDGDEVVMRGTCSARGFATIGFGECRGRVVGSAQLPI